MGVRSGTSPPLEYPSGGRGPLLEIQHAASEVVTCGGFAAVMVEGGQCRVYPLSCRRWKCRRCNANKVREAEAKLSAGYVAGETWFLTLTMPAGTDPHESFGLVTAAFKRFRQRLDRAYGHREWASVVEAQPGRGVAHLHILIRGSLLGRRWIGQAALASGFGRVADIRRAGRRHARYMVKTLRLGQTVRLPAYTRRVSSSDGWAAVLPKAKPARRPEWWIANADPAQAASFVRGLGYSVIELVVGSPSSRPPWLPVRWWPAGSRSRSPVPSLPYPEAA